MSMQDQTTAVGIASYNPPIVNPSTTDAHGLNSTAGLASKLTEGDAVGETYYEVIGESQEVGFSPTLSGVNDILYLEEKEQMTNALPEVLLDENISPEFKEKAYNAVAFDERDENTLSYQFGRDLAETPEPIASPEYETSKEAILFALKGYDDYTNAVQASLDQTTMHEKQGFVNNASDFLQLMVPFVEQGMVAQLNTSLNSADPAEIAKSFVLMGESKKEFFDAFKKMDVKTRTKAVGLFVNAIDEANTNLGYTNRLSGAAMAEELIYGDYEDWERWLDNGVSLLDASIIGKPVAWGAQSLRNVARTRNIKSTVRPASANRVAQATNATEARQQMKQIVDDETGEAAEALAGTSRDETIVDNVMPEPVIGGAGLRSKVGAPLRDVEKADITDPNLREIVDQSAIDVHTKQEVEAARAHKTFQLKNATGVSSRSESFQVEATDTGARIKGTYGPEQGGWSDAQEAIDLTAIALREQGVAKSDLKVLQRNEKGEYVEVDTIPTERGDYLVSLDFNYETTYADITNNWEQFGSSVWSILDRNTFLASTGINRYLLDPASLLNRDQYLMASAHVDLSARATAVLLENAKKFGDGLRSLDNTEQQRTLSYIKRANEEQLPFRPNQLRNEYGMTDREIDTIKKFRNFWDEAWAVENRNEASALRQEGYHVLEDAATDTRLYGKPVLKQNIDKNRNVFDPKSDDMPVQKDVDIDKLYEEGGQIIQMRRPMEYDGVVTDYVIVRHSDNFRQVQKTDVVYPYREGYYRVSYDAPHFITREVKMDDKTFSKAIATAETVEDATLYMSRLQKQNPNWKLAMHGDKLDQAGMRGFERDMFETYGRGNQRARGERLEDATSVVRNVEQTNVKGPVDSMVDTSRSLGNKIGMGNYLNTAKMRFMKEFEDLLPRVDGIPRFPATMKELGTGSDAKSGAARTQFEYLNYLEQGYVNALDEGTKAALRLAAEVTGNAGLRRTEKTLRVLSNVGPTEISKSAAFWSYIGLNPARAFLMNAHQSALLLANFSKYTLNPRGLVGDFTAFVHLASTKGKAPRLGKLSKLSSRSEEELRLMYKEFLKSGLPDSIDFNNYVRGSMTQFAENARVGSTSLTRGVGNVVQGIRSVGFDMGEFVALSTAWLAHYDKFRSGKKALTASDFSRVTAETRNYTMNMSRAGDMPYNQKSAAMLMQFFQVPHKALLNMTTNQVLSKSEKAKIFAYSSLAFGLPATTMYQYFGDILPDRDEHPDLHRIAVNGLEGVIFNKAITGLTGVETNVDWTPLSASDPSGIFEFMHNVANTEVGEILANSPSGSLLAGDNARVKQLGQTVGRWLNWSDDMLETPTDLKDVVVATGHLTSGFSNAYRAHMALESGKKVTARGVVSDPEVSSTEAIATIFGMSTLDESRNRAANAILYSESQDAVKDAKSWYKLLTAQIGREGITPDELAWEQKVMSYAAQAFKDSPRALEAIQFEIEKDIGKGNGYIYEASLRMMEIMTPSEFRAFVKNLPDDPNNSREQLLELIEVINGEEF